MYTIMPASNLTQFYRDYVKALDDRTAALFIGAGMSVAAKFPTWPELLREVAEDLNLDVDKETDLLSVAQFHVNAKKVRSDLNQRIVDAYSRNVPVPENHLLMAKLPIETVWTTNYDTLIERAYPETGKRCEAKVTPENFSTTLRGKDATVYKMHGDVTQPDKAILTKEDYELYSSTSEVFVNALKGDIVNKTFLFLGFSFTDPNIDFILSRIRLLVGKNPRRHYCIMRHPPKPRKGSAKERADYKYDVIRLQHRIGDLQRYGIEAVMIDEYHEITDILRELNRRAHRNNIFVSGSAHNYDPLGQKRIEELSLLIGQEIIQHELNLVSGFGLGIGGTVLIGAADAVFRNEKATLGDRVTMRPFPQLPPTDTRRDELWRNYRRDMLSKVGYVIFLCGNKLDTSTGQVVPADGMRKEFEIAREFEKLPIPIGATGSVAKELWQEVIAAPEQFFQKANVKQHLNTLGDESKTNQELVEAIFAIIRETSK